MSAPNEHHSSRATRLRRASTGVIVGVTVLVVALVVLALLPRSATATASLTVTPRTDAGADAALLLADRYTALADSAGTLRAVREAEPALSGMPLDQLTEATSAERSEGSATITVRVRLADRDAAVAAANAVVHTLVDAGADEQLVDVDRGGEATRSRADIHPDRMRWALAALLLALTCGLAAAALTGRRPRSAATPPVAALPPAAVDQQPAPAEVVDDLPGFLENPPGSVPPLPVAAPTSADPSLHPTATGASAAPATDAGAPPPAASRRGTTFATAAALVVLVAAALLAGVALGRSGDGPGSGAAASSPARLPAPTGAAATLTAPTRSAAPGLDATVPTTAAPASATDTAAAALAFQSVPLGRDGVAASVTFSGVVLEQRAVGLTVTYPSVSLSTDGRRSLAHVRLPTFNCLTAAPPDDPTAAGCAPSLTEYADLAGPQLQVSRNADRVDLVGLFPTYTRSNGSAPAYTGRAYQLTASIAADGPEHDGRAPAAGVVRIGLDSASTTADAGVNVLQLGG